MNRSNVGNQVANGIQILGVGATTASGITRSLAKANQALNAKTSEVDDARLENIKARTENVKARTENTKLRSEKLKSSNKVESIDDILSDNTSIYKDNSEQIGDVKLKLRNDSQFLKDWKQSLSNPEPIEELLKDVVGGKKDANV